MGSSVVGAGATGIAAFQLPLVLGAGEGAGSVSGAPQAAAPVSAGCAGAG